VKIAIWRVRVGLNWKITIKNSCFMGELAVVSVVGG
jgi:hypothetical protein